MTKLPQREVEICHRLKAFREGTKISRSRFAVTIGIGSERLASYENARAPVRYEVYRAINQHFFIDPHWLATGENLPVRVKPYDDSVILPMVKPRQLFSEVYDNHLSTLLSAENDEANRVAGETERVLEMVKGFLGDERAAQYLRHNDQILDKIAQFFGELLSQAEEVLKIEKRFEPRKKAPKR
jgi:transcriptional regulator with XRE-family HTH domain